MPTHVRRSAKRSPALGTSALRRVAQVMLGELGLERAELSVLLTDDATIRELNREWRQQDKPTDVLAFPLDERAGRAAHEQRSGGAGVVLGDVVISIDTAARQARSRKRELFEEARFLLAHGVLHLIGFDHGTPQQKQEMVALTRRLVRAASTPSPQQRTAPTARRERISRRR